MPEETRFVAARLWGNWFKGSARREGAVQIIVNNFLIQMTKVEEQLQLVYRQPENLACLPARRGTLKPAEQVLVY